MGGEHDEQTPAAPCVEASGACQSVEQLSPESTGCWLVKTRGSEHEFDLDAGTFRRLPGAGRGRFPYDDTAVVLTRIEVWPEVGAKFLVWFDDQEYPDTRERWHLSSTIASITRIARDRTD